MILEILLNCCSDAYYKCDKFSKSLLKKNLKFVSSKRDNTIAFYLGLMQLLVEVNPVAKEESCKKVVFMVHGIGYVKIILALLTKVVEFYMQALII